MKPPSFELKRARSVTECLDILGDQDVETKVIAGGQSLMPLLNLRLARPERLVDINLLSELEGVHFEDSAFRIGGLVRHRYLETSDVLKADLPILPRVVSHIGHLAIRNRGSLGGTLAHADAAGELPALMTLLGAELAARSAERGVRRIPIEAFFVGPLSTALSDDELLAEVSIPRPTPFEWHGFFEYATRVGDFARVAALIKLQAAGADDKSEVLAVRCVLFGSDLGGLAFSDWSVAAGSLAPLSLGDVVRDHTVLPDLAAGSSDAGQGDQRVVRRWIQVVTARAASDLAADIATRGGPRA